MGVCVPVSNANQLKKQVSMISSSPLSGYALGNYKFYSKNECYSFDYLINMHSTNKRSDIPWHFRMIQEINAQLRKNKDRIAQCKSQKEFITVFNSVFRFIDDLEEMVDYMISINLIMMTKSKIFNVNIGNMKSIIISNNENDNIIITELIQPHINSRARIAKSKSSLNIIEKLNDDEEVPVNKRFSTQSLTSVIPKEIWQTWQITKCLGLGKQKKNLYGIGSSVEVIPIEFLQQMKVICILSYSLQKAMSSYEVAYFINSELGKGYSAEKISKSLAEKATSILKTKRYLINDWIDKPELSHSKGDDCKLEKQLDEDFECVCVLIKI